MRFEVFIGERYFRTKQDGRFIFLITLLSIAGVAIGVMALIVVISVMAGFESDLKSRILGVSAHVVVKRHGDFSDYDPIVTRVGKIGGVTAATPFIDGQIMLRSISGASGAMIKGIDPATAGSVFKSFSSDSLARTDIPSGQTLSIATPKIILGKELAGRLGVIKGDSVHMITPRGTISPIGHLPGMKRFQVADIFATGVYQYDGALAFVHLNDAQKALRSGDTITGIEVRVDSIYQARDIAQRIVADLAPPFWADDWMQMNRNLFSALKLEKIAMFVILALIVLVAAFNIAGTLIMMVMEKTKDIAILKAMGTNSRSIRRIFIFKGMAIGTVGVALGTALGVLLCMLLRHYKFIELPDDVYYITTLPVLLDFSGVFLIALAALTICFLATLYPARQASKLNPVEAIRYG
ncbi:MAG: lipoprotein-releasing ABC transporter permease subunit [Desulfobacterales bacterium]